MRRVLTPRTVIDCPPCTSELVDPGRRNDSTDSLPNGNQGTTQEERTQQGFRKPGLLPSECNGHL